MSREERSEEIEQVLEGARERNIVTVLPSSSRVC